MLSATMRRLLLISSLVSICFAACAQIDKPRTDRELKGMAMVVEYDLAKGARPKKGVSAISDAGNEAFGTAILTSTGGRTSSFGGGTNMSFPRWIRVTWREGPDIDMDFRHGGWIGGAIIGDYKVEVLSRIPSDVFRYVAAAPGRVIVLKFRLKDDGVLFAWAVQETSANGQAWVYKMEGGDF